MGCEYCQYSNFGETECTATQIFRDGFCGVGNTCLGKKYTKPKKKRKKNRKK